MDASEAMKGNDYTSFIICMTLPLKMNQNETESNWGTEAF